MGTARQIVDHIKLTNPVNLRPQIACSPIEFAVFCFGGMMLTRIIESISALKLFVATTTVLFSLHAHAEKRVALVIGNANYGASGILANPRNDALDVAAKLRSLQFAVTDVHDLTTRDFDQAIDSFEQSAKDADIATFFYAGHGLTLDKRGFLVPVDFSARTASTAFRELVSIQDIISRIEQVARASVFMFDACRDSPMAEQLRRVTTSENRGLLPRGLPPISRSVLGSNTLVVFATTFGELASDGTGRNSPFTSALLKRIGTPNLDIQGVFTLVNKDVITTTGGKQQPEQVSRLQDLLYFASRAPNQSEWVEPKRSDTLGSTVPKTSSEITLQKSDQERLPSAIPAPESAFDSPKAVPIEQFKPSELTLEERIAAALRKAKEADMDAPKAVPTEQFRPVQRNKN